MSNYYEVLGLNSNASKDEIKRKYRTLDRKYHPDFNRKSGAEAKFKEIQGAYETLHDVEKRTEYDNKLNSIKTYNSPQQDNKKPPYSYQDNKNTQDNRSSDSNYMDDFFSVFKEFDYKTKQQDNSKSNDLRKQDDLRNNRKAYQNQSSDIDKDGTDWKNIAKYEVLSEKFIEKHKDKLDWMDIDMYQNISKEFREKHKDYFDFIYFG